jgi:hypothetical protein
MPRHRHWFSSFSHSFHLRLQDLDLDQIPDQDQDKALDPDQALDQNQDPDQDQDIGSAVFRIRFIDYSNTEN